MTPPDDAPATEFALPPARGVALIGALDPSDRASEILFGLIMVLTFTLSLGVAGAGAEDVNAVLVGALGCNLAWGIIDAVMYLMGVQAERRIATTAIRSVRAARNREAAYRVIADYLPPAVLPALTVADLERIRDHLAAMPDDRVERRIGRDDYWAAVGVFLLVFLCLAPVAVPFLLIDDVRLALRVSNIIAIGLLFLTGFSFGRLVGRPWRTGMLMVVVGVAFVAIAMLLGG